ICAGGAYCFTGRLDAIGRHESCPFGLLDCATTRGAIHRTRAFPRYQWAGHRQRSPNFRNWRSVEKQVIADLRSLLAKVLAESNLWRFPPCQPRGEGGGGGLPRVRPYKVTGDYTNRHVAKHKQRL